MPGGGTTQLHTVGVTARPVDWVLSWTCMSHCWSTVPWNTYSYTTWTSPWYGLEACFIVQRYHQQLATTGDCGNMWELNQTPYWKFVSSTYLMEMPTDNDNTSCTVDRFRSPNSWLSARPQLRLTLSTAKNLGVLKQDGVLGPQSLEWPHSAQGRSSRCPFDAVCIPVDCLYCSTYHHPRWVIAPTGLAKSCEVCY